ncbi:hypothetical protein CAMRE0001_3300 [Campylobacter rectus RM3267]|uniref:Uncharacterized protein n=1 Tax=Campylobacter rectus RM3267 TaxID=553218 RepID=B9D5S2_CAMRE|nr:hypothetical protein CAMRE0001_3300 [Campylobacter rectus RM3267]
MGIGPSNLSFGRQVLLCKFNDARGKMNFLANLTTARLQTSF